MFAPAGYTEVAANSVDAAVEKHVPVVELQREGHVLNVTVGEVEHPMEDAHYIEWIALEAAGRLEIHYLKPGQEMCIRDSAMSGPFRRTRETRRRSAAPSMPLASG